MPNASNQTPTSAPHAQSRWLSESAARTRGSNAEEVQFHYDYFKKTFNLMPGDGVMLLHTIIIPSDEEIKKRQLRLTMSRVRFIKFIMDEIYPGGRLPLAARVEEHAAKAKANEVTCEKG